MKFGEAEAEFGPGAVVEIDLMSCGRIGPGAVVSVTTTQDRCFYDIEFVPREEEAHPTVINRVDEAYVRSYEHPEA